MARRVFFSFHYKDVSDFRANTVRNCWTLNRHEESHIEASLWEEAEKKSATALKKLIDEGLYNTSVTVVLVGTETYARRWVRYEIVKSFSRGNGILAVHINSIKDKLGNTCALGRNPLDYLYYRVNEAAKRIDIWELQDGKWVTFADLPHFPMSNLGYKFNEKYKEGKLSTFFKLYDYDYSKFSGWVEAAATQVYR